MGYSIWNSPNALGISQRVDKLANSSPIAWRSRHLRKCVCGKHYNIVLTYAGLPDELDGSLNGDGVEYLLVPPFYICVLYCDYSTLILSVKKSDRFDSNG